MACSRLSLWDNVSSVSFVWYRRGFGMIILLELLFMTDSIIHVVYENWEPCFVPIVRDWNLPVTHFAIDTALYVGLFLSLLFIFESVLSPFCNVVVRSGLLLTYSYLRVIHYYNWNNHYYLNMLILILFVLTSFPNSNSLVPRWFYSVFQLLLGSVYFFAGVSKLSTAWLGGVVGESMTENHSLILPLLLLSWGGFLLDLLGGVVIIVNSFVSIPSGLFWITQVSFFFFHLHNLCWMFKSIQFFPLHMLITFLLFVPNTNKLAIAGTRRGSVLMKLSFLVVFLQAMFASRRFFILVDYPWQIWQANDIAEFHSQVHHFSWRMKSRSVSSQLFVAGKWPTMLAIGVTDNGTTAYMSHTDVYSNKLYADPELGIQPLVRRVARLNATDELRVHLFWWNEVNHEPYQLLVNPELNFVGATQIPLWGAPPRSHVEAQIVPRSDWKSLMAAAPRHLNWAPFMVRAIPEVRIPNPLIANPQKKFMPLFVYCLYGEMKLQVGEGTFIPVVPGLVFSLPLNGVFYLQFTQETLFLMAFPGEN